MEMRSIVLLVLAPFIVLGQNSVLHNIGGTIDLSGAGLVPTIKSFTVATLPTQAGGKLAYVSDGANNTDCTVGSGSFKVLCISDGTNWAPLAYGGTPIVPPPPESAAVGDFWVVRTSPTVLTIGQNCSTQFPCRVAYGTTVFSLTSPATATISAGSALAYIYVSDTQVLSVGTNGDTVVCSGCTTVGSISAFPPTSIPLWNWTASAGTWSLNGGTNQRVIIQKGADPLATYITQTADTQLKNAQNLAALASGCLSSTTGTGVVASSGAGCGVATSFSGVLPAANGGTAVANTASLTLGSSNVNLATLGTGIVKNTTTTGNLTDAVASDVTGLFSGCSGTQYLGADGACHTASGGGLTCTKYTVTQSPFGTTWTVTGQSGQAVTASTTTQTINIVTLASKVVINALRWKVNTAWAGTSMTNYQFSVGTNASGGSTATYMPLMVAGGTGNNCTALTVPFATSDSPFGDCPGYFDEGGSISGADNGETVTLSAKSTGGNLTATTAGTSDLTLCTTTLP